MENNPNENNTPSQPQGIPPVPAQPAPVNAPAPIAQSTARPSTPPVSLWPEKKPQGKTAPPFRAPATPASTPGIAERKIDDPLGVNSGKPIHLADEADEGDTPSGADLIRPLRTYRDDVAQAVKKNRVSAVSMIAREQDRGPRGAFGEPAQRSRTLVTLAGTFLILAGLSAGGYAYYVKKSRVVEPIETAIPSLIFVDQRVRVQTDGTTIRSFLVRLKNQNDATALTLGAIAQMYFTHGVGDAERTLSAPEFLAAIGARVSAEFVRALRNEFTVGTHVFDGNQPFIVLTTDLYENAFSGMLDWEATMSEDLEPFFGPAIRSTTTSETRVGGVFQNKILKNQDVRILTDSAGKTALLYGFRDRRTIIVTTNENTWNEINVRLSTARLSQ